jgi:hypothetical protein
VTYPPGPDLLYAALRMEYDHAMAQARQARGLKPYDGLTWVMHPRWLPVLWKATAARIPWYAGRYGDGTPALLGIPVLADRAFGEPRLTQDPWAHARYRVRARPLTRAELMAGTVTRA